MTSDERREQIVSAAIAVFGARGYVGTTTDDIANAAAISQPYVVRLFGSKEKLFLAALAACNEMLLTAFRGALPGDPDGRGARMGEAYVGMLRVRGLHQLVSNAFLMGGHPVIGPAARESFAKVWRFLRDEAGYSVDEAHRFYAEGMLINTMLGLRLSDGYGTNDGITELFDECFPGKTDLIVDAMPRIDEPW
jgi:AcrR family transcriptional regulator